MRKCVDPHYVHHAGGDGAGLVEHDRVDAAGALQDLRTLDQNAQLCAAARADEQCSRCGQAECAGTGDDEDGNGGGHCLREAAGAGEPETERGRGEHDDDRHEHAGNPVGQTLDRRLTGLRRFDQARHLGERCVGPDPCGANDQSTVGGDGGAGDVAAGSDLSRHAFAGDQAHINCSRTVFDDAVSGNALAGPNDEPVADAQCAGRPIQLAAVDLDHVGGVGAEGEQCSQRATRATLRAGFEPAAGEDQRDCGAGNFEVEMMAVAARWHQRHRHGHSQVAGGSGQQGIRTPAVGGQHAYRDERVHAGLGLAQVLPGGDVERPGRPNRHRCGQHEHDPLPAAELECGNHRDQ